LHLKNKLKKREMEAGENDDMNLPNFRHFMPCFVYLGHITADKRLRYALSKLPSAPSFIRETLHEIPPLHRRKGDFIKT